MTDPVERLKAEYFQWQRYRSLFSKSSSRTPDERIDASSYTKDDLGLRFIQTVEPGYDHAGYGEDIQRQVDRYEPPEKARLEERHSFLAGLLGKGYYSYAKFRKVIGHPLESLNLTWWNFAYYNSLLQMVNPGGLVFTREGTYNVGKDGGTSSTNVNGHPIKLKSNIAFEGTGFATILKMKDFQQKVGNNITDVPNTQGAPSIITTADWSAFDANSDIIIRSLQLDGNRANQNQTSPGSEHDPINLVGTKHALIEAVYVHDAGFDAFDLDYDNQTIVSKCWAKDCGGAGFHPSTGGGTSFKPIIDTPCKRVIVDKCIAENCGLSTLEFRGAIFDSSGGSDIGNVISNCDVLSGDDYGINVFSRYARIVHNFVFDVNGRGIMTDANGTRAYISFNVVAACARSGIYINLAGGNTFTYIIVQGNLCEDNGDGEVANDQDGINLEDSQSTIVTENVCRDSRSGAARTQQNGIKEYGTSDFNIIGMNRCTNNETAQIVTVGVNTITPNNITV